MKLQPFVFASVLGGLMLTSAAPASAQEDAAQPNDQVDALRACRQIAEPTQRLNCYDRAAAAMIAAIDGGEVRVVDREAVTQTRRKLFGFSLPDLGLFGGDDAEDDELDELQTTITAVRALRGDSWLLETAEGAVWRISNAPSRLRPPESGQPVVFKKAALGSYFIRIDGQTGVKGRRVD